MKVPFFKKIISYFYPIKYKRVSSDLNNILELFYYRNEWMLSTPDAIYSHGKHYTPFTIPFSKIKSELKQIKTFLLLGAGLGSAVQILDKAYACKPQTTLIDLDPQIIQLGKQLMPENLQSSTQWVCCDALEFIKSNNEKFDLIGIDVFKDMFVPHKCTQLVFLQLCQNHLNLKGILVMNYVKHQENEYNVLLTNLQTIFKDVEVLHNNQNTFFICHNY